MIEINLIPDVKREFIQAQKMRNTAISLSIFVGLISVAVVVLLGAILGGQAIHDNLTRNEIKKQMTTLQNVENIDEVVTIQNQLTKISNLHDNKSINSRIFDVLTAINPAAPNDVRISTVRVDPSESTIYIEGLASNGYPATETFRKMILNTVVEKGQDEDKETVPLSEEVTLSDTSYGESTDGSRVLRFTLSFTYPEGLLDNSVKIVRIVTPETRVVTDSRTRVPDSLFSQQADDVTEEGN